jgi:hypothetical protein
MKTLFVGGPKDGKREFFPQNYGDTIKVYSHPLYGADYDTFKRDNALVGMNIHTYTLQKFRDSSGADYTAAFHSSIVSPLEALIKGYRYHRAPRRK